MNRIDHVLQTAQQQGRKLLSPYITAGDPQPGWTVDILHQMVKAGADILEVGIPFSEPMAEGVVIQQAMERALQQGVTPRQVLDLVQQFRQQDSRTPIVLMGYANPVEMIGYATFAQQAAQAGADGMIIVDLPPEEADDVLKIFIQHGLHLIFLCSPTTSLERLKLINEVARGYVYHVSLKGVTGSMALDTAAVQQTLKRLQQVIDHPILVGFGIKTAEDAAAIVTHATGIVVGAAVIAALHQHPQQSQALQAVADFIASLRHALDQSVLQQQASNERG
ncbi:MAG: tryptophan synthase subunit alpha [Legionellales bacterium]|nr:tryptophan synthase subunit alpha [Legionellales bacterium]